MKFVNPDEAIRNHGDILPHWQQGESLQFVTFRLADALPVSLVDGWREERDEWLARRPKPWTEKIQEEHHLKFSRRIEGWLDPGLGSLPKSGALHPTEFDKGQAARGKVHALGK